MDRLEDFIRENRDHLDKYEPSPESWNKIRKRSSLRSKILIFRYTTAAAIILIAGISIFFYIHNQKETARAGIASQYQLDLRETELFYNSMYNTMYMQAKPLLTGQPEIDRELRNGAAQIDSICTDIRKDLKDNISNQEVIEALIRNYRIKVRLLEDMLNVVRQKENEDKKRDNHEL